MILDSQIYKFSTFDYDDWLGQKETEKYLSNWLKF